MPLLQEQGHTVTAVDLPGNGNDDTPLAEVTLETYAEYLCGVLDSQDGPSVLVGHSLGGISISRAAELRPGKVAVLVYLTAVLLQDGETFMSAVSDEPYDENRALETRTSWSLPKIAAMWSTSRNWRSIASTTTVRLKMLIGPSPR